MSAFNPLRTFGRAKFFLTIRSQPIGRKPSDEASTFPQLARKRKLHVFGLVDGVSIVPRAQLTRVGAFAIAVQEIDQIPQHKVVVLAKKRPDGGLLPPSR